jgi:hypothetical protein
MQNPSVLATCATRKTTQFGQRDAKCKRRTTPCTELHGRYRRPKELRRNAKNPMKTRVFERRGQEPNNLQIFWENRGRIGARHRERRSDRLCQAVMKSPIRLRYLCIRSLISLSINRLPFVRSNAAVVERCGFCLIQRFVPSIVIFKNRS